MQYGAPRNSGPFDGEGSQTNVGQDHDLPYAFARARKNQSLAVLEGFHALKHAIRFGAKVQLVVAVDPSALEDLARDLAPDLAGRFSAIARPVPLDVFKQLAKNLPHTEVISIAERPPIDVEEVLADGSPRPVVFLEDPRNLGNMGAVVRVAAAADAAGVLVSGPNDPWDPLAIRGSAGLHYALPVARVEHLPTSDRPLVAVDPEGLELNATALPRRSILAFGTERYGLSEGLVRRADLRVRIPMRTGVSSLNLATSVAVLLYSGIVSHSVAKGWSVED